MIEADTPKRGESLPRNARGPSEKGAMAALLAHRIDNRRNRGSGHMIEPEQPKSGGARLCEPHQPVDPPRGQLRPALRVLKVRVGGIGFKLAAARVDCVAHSFRLAKPARG